MTNFVKSHYKGGHRVIMGGAPCRVSYLPKHDGGRALMRESSREMCAALPPRNRKDFAQWEREQARKYAEAMKLGDRSIDDVVMTDRKRAIEPVAEPVEAVAAIPVPIVRQPVRVPVRPMMTRRVDRVMSGTMKTIAYYRVSTAKQGRSGLGLDAQRASVEAFCAGRGCQPMGEYVEIESGKNDDRPELAKALHHAKVTGSTLVIAKLDRLSRNVAFLATLQDAGVRFLCADMPEANELTLHIMAAMAQAERKAISTRTREAMAAAKARGVKLGSPRAAETIAENRKNSAGPRLAMIRAKADAMAADVGPIIADIQSAGVLSLRQIAAELNAREIMTARGGKWAAQTVSNYLKRASSS